ncbi:MAG TPA: outer membrane protein assembly factor BamA, partial [Burkholderiaceae bacterium]|nr:outer membrane protein assembly factor BamA [Burkholderiaceae bacterium]
MRPFAKTVFALAASMLVPLAWAFDPFTVRDIRLVGVQRIDPGTVFGYLPVKVGERLDDDRAAAAIRTLYATGLFNDVRLEVEGDVLVVYLEERPSIASVEVSGSKDISGENLTKALRELGLAESRIFDRALLERAEQEVKRQYLARGKYAARVTSTVTPLERNRVAVSMAIEEGGDARITQIRIVGNKAFPESTLIDQFALSTPTWLSWYTKSDQYAREKLSGDLERLRSFYLNRGYLEFSVEATQVSIDPDREGVYVTISVNEGERYTVSGFRFGGTTLGRDAELDRLMLVRPGEVFNGQRLSESTRAMTELYGSIGYAFANVNAIPEVDREKRTVAFNVVVDPGRRAYVRRINISGNARSRDEVVRRELRQFESAWYDTDKIRLSRERLTRLGYFTDVTIDTVPVPDAPDQVDLTVKVTERSTGSFLIGVGFSSTDRFIVTTSVNQQNFLGTGKSLGLNVNTGQTQRTIDIRSTDPYYTADGISRSFDLYSRRFNADQLGLGDYRLQTEGIGLRFGVPYTEVDRVSAGLTLEANKLSLGARPPIRFAEYVSAFGESSWAALGNIGWLRDGRDSPITPTRGLYLGGNVEFTLPVGDLRYTRADFQTQWYRPLTKDYTFGLQAQISQGWALSDQPYPIFKNYFAGGIGSVRGFEAASLGPRDADGFPRGGRSRFVASSEFLFPLPGSGNDQSVRLFTFLDVGNVYADTPDLGNLRASFGFGLNWLSPLGPLKLSFGYPLDKEPGDRTQRFQFQIGT